MHSGPPNCPAKAADSARHAAAASQRSAWPATPSGHSAEGGMSPLG